MLLRISDCLDDDTTMDFASGPDGLRSPSTLSRSSMRDNPGIIIDVYHIALSNVSMGSTSSRVSESEPHQSQHPPSQFRTEYHPRSRRLPLNQPFEQFRATRTIISPEDNTPWVPFRDLGDFEFVEVGLDAGLNASQVDKLLSLISRVASGTTKVNLRNFREYRDACDSAAAELTPVSELLPSHLNCYMGLNVSLLYSFPNTSSPLCTSVNHERTKCI